MPLQKQAQSQPPLPSGAQWATLFTVVDSSRWEEAVDLLSSTASDLGFVRGEAIFLRNDRMILFISEPAQELVPNLAELLTNRGIEVEVDRGIVGGLNGPLVLPELPQELPPLPDSEFDQEQIYLMALSEPRYLSPIFHKLVESKYWRIRFMVASNAQTPPEVLTALVGDQSDLVRQAVIQNEHTPDQALDDASKSDPDARLRFMAKQWLENRGKR